MTEEASSREKDAVLIVEFCDGSSMKQEFAPTAWGQITARGDFSHYAQMAEDNEKSYASFPHVRVVIMETEKDSHKEMFRCSCEQEKKEKTA